MVRAESRTAEDHVDSRDAPREIVTTTSPPRRAWARARVRAGVLVVVLVSGAGVALGLLMEGRDGPSDASVQVENGIPGAEMTDAEGSLRLHLDAARETRLATASRMTDAERSMRMHAEAAREVAGR